MTNFHLKYYNFFFEGILKQSDRFKDKLPAIPSTPRPTSDVDSVGRLLDICVQRNWPIAE